jgi:hypothetical protein
MTSTPVIISHGESGLVMSLVPLDAMDKKVIPNKLVYNAPELLQVCRMALQLIKNPANGYSGDPVRDKMDTVALLDETIRQATEET